MIAVFLPSFCWCLGFETQPLCFTTLITDPVFQLLSAIIWREVRDIQSSAIAYYKTCLLDFLNGLLLKKVEVKISLSCSLS